MRGFLLGLVMGILLVPAAGLASAWLGLLPANANAVVPDWEREVATMARDHYVERSAPLVTNPVAATNANLLAGMKIFKDGCAGCHGDPNATSDYGASFYPKAPQFALHPPQQPDYQLFWIVKNGVRYSGMSAWDGQWGKDVSDDKIWKVVTFLSHLESLPPGVDAQWRRKP
jgi:mono/diheme cytochrome c family protein